MYFRFTGDIQSTHPCPRPSPRLPLALGPVTITPYKEGLAWRACLSKVIQLQSLFLLNDLNGVECAMATPSAENLDPLGPLANSDVIKCVVMLYERGNSGNNFIRKEKFRAVLNRNYKTLDVFEPF